MVDSGHLADVPVLIGNPAHCSLKRAASAHALHVI
jgi:hypothetical protein